MTEQDDTRGVDAQYDPPSAEPLATASSNEPLPNGLCACVSDDAERCMALRHPADYAWHWDRDDEVERCECSCHDFARYDE
jgi:hypothetical protein